MHARRADVDHRRGARAVRPDPQGEGARQEHVRAGPALVALHPADRPAPSGSSPPSSPPSPRSSRPTSPRCEPGSTTARRPRTSPHRYEVGPAPMKAGHYRNITGNVALRLRPRRRRAPRRPARSSSASYPITPASDILHTLAGLKRFGVTTIQAEDEIAGVGAALGAAFGGALGVTTTSGPGLALKAETIGLAVVARAAAGRLRHPARRPLDRPADQDRAGRPAAGDVRPQRRVAGRRSSRRAPRPTASTSRSRRCASPRPTARRC